MFSSLPKLADKNFIIAFLVPTLAFGLALVWAFPQLAALAPVEKALGSQKDLTDLTVAVVGVWFCAIGLLVANHTIYRAMEGYIGPLSSPRLKARMTDRWTHKRNALRAEQAAFKALPHGPDREAASVAYNRRLADLRRRFPLTADAILGTRFGNINRAFEGYSARVYGVDSIVIWPRFSGVIPSTFQTVLSDARAQVDCFLNLTALALLFAAIEIGRWGWSLGRATWSALPPRPADMWPLIAGSLSGTDWTLLGPPVLALAFAFVTYRMLLDSALALGDQFKAAFDLYLGALPTQLGYKLPEDRDAQNEFWADLRSSYDYLDPAPQTNRLKTPPTPPKPATGQDHADAPSGGGDDDDA